MTVGDDVWDQLSAYVDGELPSSQIAEFEARLQSDPTLRAELERLRSLKQDLAQLRPPASGHTTMHAMTPASPGRRVAMAVAAAVIVMALGVAALMAWPTEKQTWLARAVALHDLMSQATYVVEEGHVARLVSSGQALEFRAPDLTASRLFLVDVASTSDAEGPAIAMHYRGMNGCRLTVVALEAGDELSEPVETDSLTYTWTHGGFNFAVIAKGMDRQRFNSVATYVEAAITDAMDRHDDLQVAMRDEYQSAQPCA